MGASHLNECFTIAARTLLGRIEGMISKRKSLPLVPMHRDREGIRHRPRGGGVILSEECGIPSLP